MIASVLSLLCPCTAGGGTEALVVAAQAMLSAMQVQQQGVACSYAAVLLAL